MAFLRFSRDKRGYEHYYLVEATPNRRGKVRARVLYWFRTPPGVKVGREPFDAEVRQALEAQNPGVVFDWRKIVETPIPSADVERWRERRRAEKAEKAARRARAADLAGAAAPTELEAEESALDEFEADETATEGTEPELAIESEETLGTEPVAASTAPAPAVSGPRESRRRRRRRGSRGSRGPQGSRGSEPREPHEPLESREPQKE